MRFSISLYRDLFMADCTEKGIWGETWTEIFHKLGFSSYKFYGDTYCGYGGKWHYLSDEEFLIFALRYS